ncbi:hypothetical protein ACFQPF_14045 [Fictibacillus iocasae]|uniref:N-acetyltransferase domain-containing protein n=1 Tax=Fictibacillus iocasae TaxID=2715437 RepID=A0ABW2NSQ0_9BACL
MEIVNADVEMLASLHGEIEKQTGRPLHFYQDREDIKMFAAVENGRLLGVLMAKLLLSERKGQIIFRYGDSEAGQQLMQHALKWMRLNKVDDFLF